MNWRESLRPASFRGVPFKIDSSEQKLGRRAVQTEFPGRDEPYPEDLGRRAWGDSLSAYVLGDDHLEQAQRLSKALNQFGPGELVHPFLGNRLVQIGEVSLRHSSREGGLSTFTIEVMEAPAANTPSEAPNTDIALQASCDTAEKTLLDEFVKDFDMEGVTQGLVDEMALAYDTALEAIAPGQQLFARGQQLWAKGQGYLDTGSSLVAKGQSWVGRVADITETFSDPLALGGGLFYGMRDILGVFGLVGDDASQSSNATAPAPSQAAPPTPSAVPAEKILDVLRKLPSVENTRITPVNLTEARKDQELMQGALLDLVHSATVIAASQASSVVEYQDQDQAEQVQQVFIAAIEQAQQRASDTVYQHLEQLRVDLVKDLSSRGAGLPSVTRVTPSQTLPALVQAYRLYGDSRREQQLVERNHLSHPGFVPAGEQLEVLQ